MGVSLVTDGCPREEGAHYTGARARRLHVARRAEERQAGREAESVLVTPRKTPRTEARIIPLISLLSRRSRLASEGARLSGAGLEGLFAGKPAPTGLQPEFLSAFLEVVHFTLLQQLANPRPEQIQRAVQRGGPVPA